jgi:hypothetical protein
MEPSRPPVLLSSPDDLIAAERGRLLAARALAMDPDQRKRMEEAVGIEYLQARYPELYKPKPFFRNLLDKITFKKL